MINNTELEIENYTNGLVGGDFMVIAGRPDMGMLPMACSLIINIITEQNKSARIVSLRTKPIRLKQRFFNMVYREKLTNVDITDETIKSKIISGINNVFGDNLTIDTQPGIDIDSLTNHLTDSCNEDLLVIDNLQLLTDSSKKFNTRWEELGSVCRKLKSLNLNIDIPFIGLSHLNREVDYREGQPLPKLSDLSDCGAIEQIADVIGFIYRPEYYGIKTDPNGESVEGMAQFIISRNALGPIGTIELEYIKEHKRFERLVESMKI